jgi:hypothetical protein
MCQTLITIYLTEDDSKIILTTNILSTENNITSEKGITKSTSSIFAALYYDTNS